MVNKNERIKIEIVHWQSCGAFYSLSVSFAPIAAAARLIYTIKGIASALLLLFVHIVLSHRIARMLIDLSWRATTIFGIAINIFESFVAAFFAFDI